MNCSVTLFKENLPHHSNPTIYESAPFLTVGCCRMVPLDIRLIHTKP